MTTQVETDWSQLLKPGLVDAFAMAMGWTDAQLTAYKAGLRESAKYCDECGRKFVEEEN